MATVFVSPGVYTKEQDFSVFASRIGLTRLGLVGLTLKGPAFEPIKVKSTDEFLFRFGTTNPNLELPYVANAFLTQSDELTVTRILGKEGFTNSPAWILAADFDDMYSGAVTYSGMTFTKANATDSTVYNFIIQENSVMTDGTVSASTTLNDTTISFSGVVSTLDVENLLETDVDFSALGITIADGDTLSAITDSDLFSLSATTLAALGSKSGATLCVIRSKPVDDSGNSFILNNETDVELGTITSTLGQFMISASTGSLAAYTEGVLVSLDETREDYILNVIGNDPTEGSYDIYVESIYPHFIREADARGDITTIYPNTVFTNETAFTDYTEEYTNPSTPWIVSRVVGSDVKNLFKFDSISDGNSANEEIKISISNIDTVNKTFDVIIRAFSDTDATALQTAYERFRTVTMDKTKTNFIGRAIGTTDEEYPKKSMFVTLELADDFMQNTVPAGFRGYELRDTGISGTTTPDIYYKTEYFSGDSVYKTYLGISELGYTGFTSDQVSTTQTIKTIEKDMFMFNGTDLDTTIKGFHLESTADATAFITGAENSLTGYTKSQRKFTLVPARGFDGWNPFKTPTFTTSSVDTSNVAAYKEAIDTMANPEEADINLFATNDVNFADNEAIIKYALSMVEDRADALYIMNAPRLTVETVKGTSAEVVSNMQDTGIDSNYAATYWPWIQIEDINTNQYVYIPPTREVVRTIALTDNVSYPWFAPAGFNRGNASSSVVRADIKLSRDDRDTLYDDRINPIATFVQQGVVIYGQKTLQINQSALDRINVRRLLLQVRRLIAAASQTLLFEQNDQALRDQFLARVEPILLQIQNQRGLTAFNVVMDESNNTPETVDRNQLNGKIQIKPTPSAEFISLDFQVLPTGANFEDF